MSDSQGLMSETCSRLTVVSSRKENKNKKKVKETSDGVICPDDSIAIPVATFSLPFHRYDVIYECKLCLHTLHEHQKGSEERNRLETIWIIYLTR